MLGVFTRISSAETASAERSTTAQQKWHERSTAEVKEMNELTDSWVTDQSHNQWTITELWTTEQTSSATPRTKVINEIPVSWVKGQSRLGQPALLEFTEHRKIKLALNAGALEATNGSLKVNGVSARADCLILILVILEQYFFIEMNDEILVEVALISVYVNISDNSDTIAVVQ